MRYWKAVFFSLLLGQALAFSAAPDAISLAEVQAALEKLDATNLDDDWYFTMEIVDGEELQLVKSDPSRDKYDRRQLLTVNGVTPDDEHLDAFREAEEKRIGDLDPETSGYVYMVDTETLELVEEADGHIELSFVPRVKAMENSRENLRGTLLLNTGAGQIEKLEIHNTEELSPAFSVTVDTYRLALRFQLEQGENLLQKLESHAVGKAAFIKSFDSQVEVTFSDYRRAHP
jgi:hypothetical protein